jgi:pyruvate formate lyase activating enzyme
MFSASKCIRCCSCIKVCPENAITLTPSGIYTDPDKCTAQGKCAGVCPSNAIEMSGKVMTTDKIIEEIEKERVFFDQSGGGVTFSGGEPLLHTEKLMELLKECGRRKIHRAVDTAGNIRTETILNVAKETDLFLYDLKMMDNEKHKRWTGSGNELILKNLSAVCEAGAEVNIRMPVIGGINDSMEDFNNAAAFISSLAGKKKDVNLLPYHKIAQHKYAKLGRPGTFEEFTEPAKENLADAIGIFSEYGIKAVVGG